MWQGMEAPAVKICVRCGRDCAAVPRVRDAQGRYCCRDCQQAPAGIIPLAPAEPVAEHRAPCPKCGADLRVGVASCESCGYAPEVEPGSPKLKRPKFGMVICGHCKYDLTGLGDAKCPKCGKIKPVKKKLKTLTCRQCGYDLTGLRNGKCPECGHTNAVTGRREWDDEISAEIRQHAYRKPLIYLVIGLIITFGVYAAQGNTRALTGYAIAFPVTLLVAYGMLWLCCLTWLGFTSSSGLMLLQLAGIHGAVGALSAVFSLMPAIGTVSLIPLFACGTMYVYLMSDWMDMEGVDAKIASVIIYFSIMMLAYGAAAMGLI